MDRLKSLGLTSITLSCLAVACIGPFARASSDDVRDAAQKKEITQLEEDRNQAILRGDTAALDRMTSDDYTFINQRGELRTKTEILTGFKSGTFNYGARKVSELMVRIYGDTAVVTGRAVQEGTENAKDYSGENRFTRVYVKRDGHWVSVALQVTVVEVQPRK
jgi:ketosteroid isomerase-like protein